MSEIKASILGLKKSFGFGDRLGNATPGHFAAAKKFDFAPIYAQQSIREMARTQRTAEEVMAAAVRALTQLGYTGEWGADADHLKTREDIQVTTRAGFCFFTIDPSEYVVNEADTMSEGALQEAVTKLQADGILSADWESAYLGKAFEIDENITLQFDREALYRAAVKYARAIDYSVKMAGWIAEENAGRAYEVEVSVDETDSPTSPLEHLFFGYELKQRGAKQIVSLAPRFIGDFEKGIDYKGDLKEFEARLVEHVAVAKYCGPYKISVHSGSDKFSAYPIIGRVCGDLLHVKTAGTSYLEALRVVVRVNPGLFKEIAAYCAGRFEEDLKSYHISTNAADVAALAGTSDSDLEEIYLNQNQGRQLLHVTFGSVLTLGKAANGQTFKQGVMDILNNNEALHQEVLDIHFTKHLQLLNQG